MTGQLRVKRPAPAPRKSWPVPVIGAVAGVLAGVIGLLWFEHRPAERLPERPVERQATLQGEPEAAPQAVTPLPQASKAGDGMSLVAAQSPQAAYDDAKAVNTIAAWDGFLAKMEAGELQYGPLADQARRERAKLIAAQDTQPAFDRAKKANTVLAWDNFLAKVDSGEAQRGPLADQARQERAKLIAAENAQAAFDQAKDANSVEALDEFLAKVESGEVQSKPLADQARRERAKLAGGFNPQPAYDEARAANTIEAWDVFIAKVKTGEVQGGPLTERARRERNGLLVGELQTELKRVGCDPGPSSSEWREGSRRALEAFNTNAGTNLDASVPSVDALKAVQAQSARVCPLTCGRGMRADGDTCVAIECNPDDGNDCQKPAPAAAEAQPAAEEPQPRAQPKRHAHTEHRAGHQPQRGKRGTGCMVFGKPAAC